MSEPVRCSACSTPVAAIRGGVLEIIVRHHGERHSSTFTLVELEKLLTAQKADHVP